MMSALRAHWPEYVMEAGGLAAFMISASAFGVLLEYPGSPVHRSIADPFARRALMGVAMGLTAIAIIYSPLGKRSGAHINPSVTLAFLRLGRIKSSDAVFYVLSQFSGAIVGMLIAWAVFGARLANRPPRFVITAPGMSGVGVAFVAEVAISALLMLAVLTVSGSRFAPYAGLCAGTLVALYITFEAPLSGMSMNPARTLGSALAAGDGRALWIYFIAPPLGMMAAASVYQRIDKGAGCAKLYHPNNVHCIFCEK
jgi:aquaporin Z